MATATAPIDPAGSASTTPASAPSTSATAPGPLARILTPVEPARPAQPLGATTAMGQLADGDSGSNRKGSSGKVAAGKGSDRDGPVAALVHALAERLRRGGTSVKRTHDIKETRVSGSTNAGSSANKAERLAKHDGQHHTNRDAKIADLNNKVSQRHGKNSRDTKRADTTGAKSTNAKAAKAERKDGSAGTPPKQQSAGPLGSKAATTADDKATPSPAKGSAATKAADGAKPGEAARPSTTAPAKPADPKGLNAKTAAATKPASTSPSAPAKDTSAAPPASPATATAPAAPRPRTRGAREAGYRDGTRAAATVGQARAYRDGAVDGWDDRTAADKTEGRIMSDARARNAATPKAAAAPKMAPASGSTVDLAKKPAAAAVPVQVTALDDKAVGFTAAGGAQHTMSRGEVRTLKAFERRVASKRTVLGRLAEGSKTARSHATGLADRAQGVAEDAKSIEGGSRIVGRLLRLAEHAQVLRTRAEEIEKAAHRGAEAVVVLAANAETRHGGIYRAVVDSPLTTPAEREFYQDTEGS